MPFVKARSPGREGSKSKGKEAGMPSTLKIGPLLQGGKYDSKDVWIF